jgi:hypothetical protein
MTPALLRKVKELVADGASVLAATPPQKAPGLTYYPQSDVELKRLADELWKSGKLELWKNAAAESVPIKSSNLSGARWIWRNEGNPAASAPPGARFFRRVVVLDAGNPIKSARLVMTADNSFECSVNGQRVGAGDNFTHAYVMDVTKALKPGTNVVTVTAVNATDAPSPAALIGALTIQFQDGHTMEVVTDASWEAAEKAGSPWAPALAMGPLGMAPWGHIDVLPDAPGIYPDANLVANWLGKHGVPPDFMATTRLRFIHRVIDDADVYFVANLEPREIETVGTFRVTGKSPELWWPDTGRREQPASFEDKDGLTRLSLRLDPSGSVFVVFRRGTATAPRAETMTLVTQQEITGPWEVAFDPKWGGPEKVTFEKLEDWSKRPEAGIKYYSGTATYRTTFRGKKGKSVLDLGKVAVMADVTLNGQLLGTLWKPPYRVDVTDALRDGENTLEVKVVNLWVNRQIGDEQLPEDSDRNKNGTLKSWPQWVQEDKSSPTGRYTFGSWRLWKKTDPLVESGLIGPVMLRFSQPVPGQ